MLIQIELMEYALCIAFEQTDGNNEIQIKSILLNGCEIDRSFFNYKNNFKK